MTYDETEARLKVLGARMDAPGAGCAGPTPDEVWESDTAMDILAPIPFPWTDASSPPTP